MQRRKGKSHKEAGHESKLLNVVVSEEYLDRVREVADRLRSAGMRVGRVMEMTGTIEGSVDSRNQEHLRDIEGVEAIEEQRGYQLPPSDSELQ